jgi:hypothetical protein
MGVCLVSPTLALICPALAAIGLSMAFIDTPATPLLGNLVDQTDGATHGTIFALQDMASCAGYAFACATNHRLRLRKSRSAMERVARRYIAGPLLVAAVRASDHNLQLYWLTIPLAVFCLFVLIALFFARSQDRRTRRLFSLPKDEPSSVFHTVSRVISGGSRLSKSSLSGSLTSRSGSLSVNGEVVEERSSIALDSSALAIARLLEDGAAGPRSVHGS